MSAASATVSGGVALLAVYSLGLGVPFLLAALFTDGLMARLKAFGRIGRALQLLAGAIRILMGIAMLTGPLSAFSYWLLETFPGLATIGCRPVATKEQWTECFICTPSGCINATGNHQNKK